ncbi:putative XRE-type DNA-binding protein [Dyadobacter sp. BE34]|uniref:XRE-type DNA-binding protein n=1 Tax=Dyadobacter fermentans TaxID=94254 RepID=A0ABU1R8M0_9BACT|nr:MULTISPECIES: hypothetical protein [Dyadobacter]MDR6809746.1 putative XRE-type DNA-binding protein [Dyadobacter fermentans]MDR7047432.1 putative XRE-type DNA-binding protein [Dyadobacter sp. BE242]MDR7201601.1 putative XRE-type DNA-binding protein [Dyadobacter sp. BE34]MDR7219471.1 putative XRE-type DNA-binding protein [Dyadobacter sp. BE31]MDR7267238.1 putative XRE-type DNA-binding protein [Dyadobacter sp. BE32]
MNTLDVFIEKGRRQGIEEAKLQKTETMVRNLIKQSILNDDQIASAIEVTVKYVAEVRRQISDADIR